MSLKIKHLIVLAWGSWLITKFAYLYIAFHGESRSASLRDSFSTDPASLAFLALGSLAAIAGTILARKLYRDVAFTKRILRLARMRDDHATTDEYLKASFHLYTVYLGFFETTALFGFVGFLQSSSLPFLVYMFSISILGWALSKPAFVELETALGN